MFGAADEITHLVLETSAFSAKDGMHLMLNVNVFGAKDELTCLAIETNALDIGEAP